jgi:hypothetical protein
MKYEIIKDAPVLLPNPDHQNFTQSKEVIPQGFITEGKPKTISGLRKGQPFVYRLFVTEDKRLIHLNKVKPMETTEVTLGADAQASPTIVSIANKKVLSLHTAVGAGLGLGAGYWWSKKKGYSTQKTAIVSAVCGILGYVGGLQLEKRGIFVKKSQ